MVAQKMKMVLTLNFKTNKSLSERFFGRVKQIE